MGTPGWDAFISHASEDKDSIVRPLAEELRRLGLRVWYDEFELHVGDSLSRSIDIGLTKSRYGVVILSRAFFDKDWPEEELDALLTREVGGAKVILPIWHGVTGEEVKAYSARLADRFALDTSKLRIEDIALKLLGEIDPSLYAKRKSNEIAQSMAALITDAPVTNIVTVKTKIVVAPFEGTGDNFAVDSVIIDALRVAFANNPDIEITTLDRPLPTSVSESYQVVSAASDTGAAVLLSGAYSIDGDTINLAQVLYMAEAPFQPAATFRRTNSESVAAIRRAEPQLLISRILRSLAFYIAGQKRLKNGDLGGAVAYLSASLQVAAEDERFASDSIYLLRGLAFFVAGDKNKALDDFTDSLRIKPNLPAFSNRGAVRVSLEDPDGALNDLDEALKLDPGNILALTNRASALSGLNHNEEAIRDLDKVLGVDPAFAAGYYNCGNAWFALKELGKAKSDYDRAIELNPKMASAFSRRAFTEDALGSYEKATSDYETAIELEPNGFGHYLDAAKTKIHIGDLHGAIEFCNRALVRSPDYVDIYRTRGCAFYEAKEYANALNDFTQVLYRGSVEVSDLVNSALANKQLGNRKAALAGCQKALELARARNDQRQLDTIDALIDELNSA